MVKVTFTLDDETVARIRRAAGRHAKPQSAIVREAVAEYAARADATGDADRENLIRALDRIPGQVSTRDQYVAGRPG